MKGELVRFEIYEQGKVFVDSVVIDNEIGNVVYLKLKLSIYNMKESNDFKSRGFFSFAEMPGIVLCDNTGIGKFTKVIFTGYKGYQISSSLLVENGIKIQMHKE